MRSLIMTAKCALHHHSCLQRLLRFVIFRPPMPSAYHFQGENNANEPRLQSTCLEVRYRSLFYEETRTTALHLWPTYCTIRVCKCPPLHYACSECLLLYYNLILAAALRLQSTYIIVRYKPLYCNFMRAQHCTYRQIFTRYFPLYSD